MQGLEPRGEAVWVDETLWPEPRDVYDETKLAAERIVAATGLEWVVLRIARCFPEPLEVMARHHLHRASRWTTLRTRICWRCGRSSGMESSTSLGRTRSSPPTAAISWMPPTGTRRAPGVARAFVERGWSLPRRIDRGLAAAGRHEVRRVSRVALAGVLWQEAVFPTERPDAARAKRLQPRRHRPTLETG